MTSSEEPQSFYTCTDSTSSLSLLLQPGTQQIDLSYYYEIDTPTITLPDGTVQDVVGEAIEHVQNVMLHRVAERSGLLDCPEGHPWRERRVLVVEGNDKISDDISQRRLARGSTSIVGVSSSTLDEVDSTEQCASSLVQTETNTGELTAGSAFDSSDVSVDLLLEGFGDTILPSEPAIDASAAKRSSGLVTTRNGEILNTNVDSNDNSNLDISFNYMSTESLPLSRTSLDPQTHSRSGSDFISEATPRMTTKCTIVHGHMSIFTRGSSDFENLDVRVLNLLEEDTNSPLLMKELFLSEIVHGVKFLGKEAHAVDKNETIDNATGDPISNGAGYVSAIQGSPSSIGSSSSISNESSFFTIPMIVLITLGALFIVLLGLFVRTSRVGGKKRVKKQQRGGDVDISGDSVCNGTYHDEEVEMDLKELSFDDESDASSSFSRSYYEGDQESTMAHSGIELDCFGQETSNDLNSNSDRGVKIQTAHNYMTDNNDDSYTIHSIRSATDYSDADMSHYNNVYGSIIDKALAIIPFGETRVGSLASHDSLSEKQSSKKKGERSSKVQPPSRLFRSRSSQKRYVGVPSSNASVAREVYVDEEDANQYDPDSMGMEVTLNGII